MSETPRYSFAFVIEQVLGHITHGDNLRAHVPDDPDVRAHWILPEFPTGRLGSSLPGYRSNWTLRCGHTARRGLRRLAQRTELDAIFFHTQVPAMLAPDWVRRVPSVLSVDATPRQYDELGEHYGHEVGRPAIERWKSRALRRRLDDAAHVVTWSDWAKQGLIDDYAVPEEHITVVPPGVSVSDWRSADRKTQESTPVRMLFVGGDFERKGGLLLLEAFRRVRDRGVELHLVTKDNVAAEPGVHVHNDLRPNSVELRSLFVACDIFALPTYGDCLPMVLSEAGASGVATISTRVGAIPEVVVDGVTGLLIAPGDLAGLTDAVERLVERPEERRSLGDRAADHIARHYDTETNTQTLLAIMKDQAAERERTQ